MAESNIFQIGEMDRQTSLKNKFNQENRNNIFSIGNEDRRRETLGFSSSRGQIFVIGAVLMIIGMVLIFSLFGGALLSEEKKFQEARVADKTARNILNELRHAAAAGSLQANARASASTFLSEFSDYVRSQTDASIFYFFVFSNGSTQRYFVEVGNYMGDAVNVTINVTNSSIAGNSTYLIDKSRSLSDFSSSINGTLNVTISYTLGNAVTREEVFVNVTRRHHFFSFFDVTARDKDYFVRIKETHNRTWG